MATPAWMFPEFGGQAFGFQGYVPAAPPAPVCTSCGEQLMRIEAQFASAQAGRCNSCQQLHQAGSYCRVCDKVWKPTDKNMVGCDSCDFWIHDHCDPEAARVLASNAEDETYYCPPCRQASAAQHAQLAALAQAEAALRQAQPRNARSAYEIFAGEMLKQYTPQEQMMFGDMQHIIADTWRQLKAQERAPYEAAAQHDFHRYLNEKGLFDELQAKYMLLRRHTEESGLYMQQQQLQQQQRRQQVEQEEQDAWQDSPRGGGRGGAHNSTSSGRGRGGGAGPKPKPQRGHSLQDRNPRGRPRKHAEYVDDFEDEETEEDEEADAEDDDEEFDIPPRRRHKGPPARQLPAKRPAPSPTAKPPAKRVAVKPAVDGLPSRLPVVCHGTEGIFLVAQSRVICECAECAGQPESQREMSATHFEAHAGAGAAKKWKSSVRIVAGAVPEAPIGGTNLSVGKWLIMVGLEEAKDAKPKGTPPLGGLQSSSASAMAGGKGSHKVVVKKEGVSGSGSAKLVKWEDLPSEPRPNGTSKPKIGRPTKEQPKEAERPTPAPWLEIPMGLHTAVRVRWAGDRCSVCDSDVDYDFDQLVSCDACGITVHQSCYGVPEAPGVEDMWLCRACELKEEGKPPPQCCLCPVAGGALKPTTIAGLWAHAACMQWIPEVTVGDMSRMEPVDRIQAIQKERWELLCGVCRQRCGAKIQCTSCYSAYHPLCGRLAGLHMNIDDGTAADGSPDAAVRLVSYCARHCTPHPELSGVRLEKDVEAEEEAEADERERSNGLWNAQPFRQPPAAPLPECPAGCARAQPIQEWHRASHGTGMGCSSTAGFWIPDQAPQALLPLTQSLHSSKKGKKDSSRAARPPRPPPKPRELRPAFRGGAASDSSSDGDEPPSEVELMALPDDVPEEQTVVCGNKVGTFLTRMQRVVLDGVEMSASRFEQVSGKGDAKKWKCSIYADMPGGPVVMMDWLAERGLDRKALGLLQANATAHEAYREHVEDEVTAVLSSIVGDLELELDPEAAAARAAAQDEEESEEEAEVHADSAAVRSHVVRPQQQRAVLKGGPLRKADGRFMSREEAARYRARLAAGLEPEIDDGSAPAGSLLPPAAASAVAAPDTGREGGSGEAPADPALPATAASGSGAAQPAGMPDAGEAAARMRPPEEDGAMSAQPAGLRDAGSAAAAAPAAPVGARGSHDGAPPPAVAAEQQAAGHTLRAASASAASSDCPDLHVGKAELAAAAAAAASNGVTLEQLVAHLRREGSAASLNGLTSAAKDGTQASSLQSARNSLAKDDDGSRFLEALFAMAPGSPHEDSDVAPWPQEQQASDGRLDPIALSRAAAERHSSDHHRPPGGHLSILDRKLTGFSDPGSPLSESRLLHPVRSRMSSFDLENALTRSSDEEDAQHPRRAYSGADQPQPNGQMEHHHEGRHQQSTAPQGLDLNLDASDSEAVVDAPHSPAARPESAAGRSSTLLDSQPAPAVPQLSLEERLRQAQGAHPARRAGDSTDGSALQNVQPPERGMAVGGAASPAPTQRHRVVWIWIAADQKWYSADVVDHDTSAHTHRVVYHINGKGEWLDLAAAEREERLRWGDDSAAAAPSGAQEPKPVEQLRQDAGDGAMPADPEGWRIGVWWPDDGQFYYGAVGTSDGGMPGQPSKHLIHYDDGLSEFLDLSSERLHWAAPPGTDANGASLAAVTDGSAQPGGMAAEQSGNAGTAARPAPADGVDAPAADAPKEPPPDKVGVVCGSLVGLLLTRRLVVRMADGREVSPTEFEREGGKGSSKKWKSSLRVDKGGGVPGRTMAEWLVDVGIDQPRTDRAATERGPAASAAQAALRRRQVAPGAFRRPAPAAGRSSGHAHRDGCMCVICKQARKTGKLWAGMTGGPPASGGGGGATFASPPPPPGRRGPLPGGPPPRIGKRAFMHALPHLPAGARHTALWRLPASKSYTAAEWEAQQAGDDDSDSGRLAGRGLTMKERLAQCSATEKQRLAFGKSGIHGWGLFAKCALPQDSMVMEYRGEVVRRVIGDRREAAYRAAGKDCYLFTLDDETIIDSTVGGNIARFTNHCCAPSLYIKVLEVDGRGRLLFFARHDIAIGQELTFDYRFKVEEGAAKLPCRCGAPNCRGTLN